MESSPTRESYIPGKSEICFSQDEMDKQGIVEFRSPWQCSLG